jgi:ABC-type sulfate transport system permease component
LEVDKRMARQNAISVRSSLKLILPCFCIAAVIVVLLFYMFLLAGNAGYLGWGDAGYFFRHPRFWQRLWLTLWTATMATGFSLLAGIPSGYALSRLRFPMPKILATLIDLPVMVPAAAVGVFLFGLVQTFPIRNICDLLGLHLGRNVAGVVFVQFAVTAAFCSRLMKASFDAVNPRFEKVSRSLGASVPHTFFRVTLPLAKKGIVASTMAVWARAAAEWEALMLFVGGIEGRTDVMPFAVYLDWNGAMMGWCVSLSLGCVLLAVAAMTFVRLISGKSYVW